MRALRETSYVQVLGFLAVAFLTLLVGDYLYQGARRAQAEARLADARAVRAFPGSSMARCIAGGDSVERCARDLEAERRRAETARAAPEHVGGEAAADGETVSDPLDESYGEAESGAGAPEPDPLAAIDALYEGSSSERRGEAATEAGQVPETDRLLRLDAILQRGEEAPPAVHEAAHAVVSARLGLPLKSTDIIERRQVAGAAGTLARSQGYTTLRDGTTAAWLEALPDPEARMNLQAFAAQGAAGVVAEKYLGSADDDPAVQEDLTAVIAVADNLGIGRNPSEPPVRRFIMEAIARAEAALMDDGGVAWERVAEALLERRALSGDEVNRIVSER